MRLNLETRNEIRSAAGEILSGHFDNNPYVDIPLVGFRVFVLEIDDIVLSASDLLSIALSQDAGVSFINDVPNFDSYLVTPLIITNNATVAAAPDALISPTGVQDVTSPLPCMMRVRINIGSLTKLALVTFESICDSGSLVVTQVVGNAFINPNATIPPQTIPVNLLRLICYGGSGDATTSPNSIVGGTYRLFGVI